MLNVDSQAIRGVSDTESLYARHTLERPVLDVAKFVYG